jgi:thioesterase domain-containing protein
VESYLRSCWSRIAGESLVGDDFLAGHHNTAAVVKLVADLRRSGFAISARDVIANHTVQSLAAIMPERHGEPLREYPTFSEVWESAPSRRDRPSTRSLVPIARGTGTPLFFVHSALGYIRFLRHVVDDFRDGRPVYGFESAGIRHGVRPPLSIGETAERYVAEIREVQPRGPYRLAGMCTGSQIAYEMAGRITADGDEVAVLALVNSYRPGVRQVPSGWGMEDLYNVRIARLQLLLGAFDLPTELPRVVGSLRQMSWVDDVTVQNFYWHVAVYAATAFGQEHYDPRPYPVNATVFQPTRTTNGDHADWTPLVPHATTHHFHADNSLAVMGTRQFAASVAS